jgi:hypothetical protein
LKETKSVKKPRIEKQNIENKQKPKPKPKPQTKITYVDRTNNPEPLQLVNNNIEINNNVTNQSYDIEYHEAICYYDNYKIFSGSFKFLNDNRHNNRTIPVLPDALINRND